MTEQFITTYGPQRAKERGFKAFRYDYRDVQLPADSITEIKAYNEMWFVLAMDSGVSISSDDGELDFNNPLLSENMHEHSGRIIFKNENTKVARAQCIIITHQDDGNL